MKKGYSIINCSQVYHPRLPKCNNTDYLKLQTRYFNTELEEFQTVLAMVNETIASAKGFRRSGTEVAISTVTPQINKSSDK